MSEKELVIGSCEQEYEVTRLKIPEEDGIRYVLSHNAIEYYVQNCIGGFNLKVSKKSKEGYDLQEMLQNKQPLSVIRAYFEQVILEILPVEDIVKLIVYEKDLSYNQGSADKLAEIRQLINAG